jgi:hypothetical protein
MCHRLLTAERASVASDFSRVDKVADLEQQREVLHDLRRHLLTAGSDREHIPDSPEGEPDRSPGWMHRQFISPHKGVWDIPEHELDDRWNGVYDALGFDPKTRDEWEAGRHTDNPADKWDAGMDGTFGGGVQDYLTHAPMSKEEYARHREDSQNRAKGIADGLWNAMYPPEEEEGRIADRNMDTVNNLMNNGWQPEHIKYDEDDEPYAHYQHPSGWNVTDRGGMYKDVGHVATPGEAHDVINVSNGPGGEHDLFGPAEAHSYIENQLHGDPEETGGTFQHLTQNDPRIRKYKNKLSSHDQRFVDLEAPKFIRAHQVPLDELQIRAAAFVREVTGSLPQKRSRAITAAFVGKVTELYRPPRRVASKPSNQDFPDELMFT